MLSNRIKIGCGQFFGSIYTIGLFFFLFDNKQIILNSIDFVALIVADIDKVRSYSVAKSIWERFQI